MKKTANNAISQRAFGRKLGVSHTAVAKAILTGRIDVTGDKGDRVNLLGVNTKAYIGAQKARVKKLVQIDAIPVAKSVGPKSRKPVPHAELERRKLLRQIERLEMLNRRAEISIQQAEHELNRSKREVITTDQLTEYLDRFYLVFESLAKATVDRIYPALVEVLQGKEPPGFYSELWKIMAKDLTFVGEQIDLYMKNPDLPIKIDLPKIVGHEEKPDIKPISVEDAPKSEGVENA